MTGCKCQGLEAVSSYNDPVGLMNARAKLQLSRLREIGWSRWDPIDLRGLEHASDDEYDSYLLHAAGHLWDGASEEEVINYLVNVEAEDMALDGAPDARIRAREVVSALSAYVSSCRC
jgi:hypothetical protein